MSAQTNFVRKQVIVHKKNLLDVTQIVDELGAKNNNWSSVANQLLRNGIRLYRRRKNRVIRVVTHVQTVQAPVAPPVPEMEVVVKGGTAFCQNTGCGKEVNRKKLHPFQLQSEVFLFCEGCFFTGAYKDLIRGLL